MAAGRAHAQRSPGALSVHIESPNAGIVDERETVWLRAVVSGPLVATARVDVNGATGTVAVHDGVIALEVVPFPGNNRVALSVRRGAVTASASVTFFQRAPHDDLRVVMSWPSHGDDLRLRVFEPCEGEPRGCEAVGRIDGSTGGRWFGMAGLSLPVRAGRYRVEVEVPEQGSAQDDGVTGWDALTSNLDEIDRSLATASPTNRASLLDARRTALAALDRWARPTTLRTQVHVEAVLFAGTPHERRWRYDCALQRVEGSVDVGAFEVTDAMVRAERGGP